MSNQPPYGQGSWQQPPGPPGQGPGGPPGGPGRPGGPPEYGRGTPIGGPPGKSKLPLILGVLGGVVAIVGAGLLLYFFVLTNNDDEAAGDDYCTLLQDNVAQFGKFTEGETKPRDIENAVGVIHEIREAAPESVAKEWAALDDPLQEFQQVLDDADLSWQDIAQRDPGEEIPNEVDEAAQKMSETFFGLDFNAMNRTISNHAKRECGINLEELESPSASATPPS
jgi:hypothetical protein